MNWKDYLGYDPAVSAGWIPPEDRTLEMQRVDAAFDAKTPTFGDLDRFADVPDSALLVFLELKHHRGLLFRIHQLIGSCVGAGGARAYGQSIVGDMEYRGDIESIEPCFPWATWGKGRQMGGLRGRGDGSFGAAQAEAVNEWGMWRASESRLPQPTVSDGVWLRWTKQIELNYSWPPSWPSTLDNAGDYLIGDVARVTRDTDELAAGVAQGRSVTLASMFGTGGPKLRDGVMLADWNSKWAHQMSSSGYVTHPKHGRIWLIDNQWSFGAHPVCPYLASLIRGWCEQLGIEAVPAYGGSFWILDSIMARIIRTGEVFLHSATKGFDPRPPFDWTKVRFA